MRRRRVAIPRSPAPPAWAGRRPGGWIERLRGETMGTTWSVTLATPARAPLAAIASGVQAVLDGVVAQMSGWLPSSDLARFNRAPPGSWHRLPDDFYIVLDAALSVARETGGAYDPTVGPLVDLWGFGPPGPCARLPDGPAVEAARMRCGWQTVALDRARRQALQPGGVTLDLSSIAKGFAVDRVAAFLRGAGVADMLVEVGGELSGHGTKPDGTPWWVALETPPSGDAAADGAATDAAETVLALHGLAVATSGDYRRRFEVEGRRHAHILDPRTGRPADNDVASVTVLHAECMMADALATALAVAGLEAGMAHAHRHDLATLFVVRGPDTGPGGFADHASSAFAAMLD